MTDLAGRDGRWLMEIASGPLGGGGPSAGVVTRRGRRHSVAIEPDGVAMKGWTLRSQQGTNPQLKL